MCTLSASGDRLPCFLYGVLSQLHATLAGLTEKDDVAMVLALLFLVSLKSVTWMISAHFSYWNPEYKHKCSWQKI